MTKTNNGFTLIETAVVLVIFGIMASAAFGFVNSQLQQSRINSTKIKQDAIKNALISFISRNSRLPCPAVASLAPGAVGYGVEAATPGTCAGTIINGTGASRVTSGIVPFSSLGLTDDAASDGYYNRITYIVTLSATNTNSDTVAGMLGSISIHTQTPAAIGLPAVGNQVNYCMPVGGNYNPCAAVAALISHGNNGFGAYSEAGVQQALPAGPDELENANADSKLVMHDYSNNAANPFDDIVLPLSATDLLGLLEIKGSMDDTTTAMNKKLNVISAVISANAFANRTGTSGAFVYPIPLTLPSLPSTTLTDPWGNPFKYQQLTNAISSSSSSSGGAYSLTSYGPDGVPGGNDDILKIVYVGQVMTDINKNVW